MNEYQDGYAPDEQSRFNPEGVVDTVVIPDFASSLAGCEVPLSDKHISLLIPYTVIDPVKIDDRGYPAIHSYHTVFDARLISDEVRDSITSLQEKQQRQREYIERLNNARLTNADRRLLARRQRILDNTTQQLSDVLITSGGIAVYEGLPLENTPEPILETATGKESIMNRITRTIAAKGRTLEGLIWLDKFGRKLNPANLITNTGLVSFMILPGHKDVISIYDMLSQDNLSHQETQAGTGIQHNRIVEDESLQPESPQDPGVLPPEDRESEEMKSPFRCITTPYDEQGNLIPDQAHYIGEGEMPDDLVLVQLADEYGRPMQACWMQRSDVPDVDDSIATARARRVNQIQSNPLEPIPHETPSPDQIKGAQAESNQQEPETPTPTPELKGSAVKQWVIYVVNALRNHDIKNTESNPTAEPKTPTNPPSPTDELPTATPSATATEIPPTPTPYGVVLQSGDPVYPAPDSAVVGTADQGGYHQLLGVGQEYACIDTAGEVVFVEDEVVASQIADYVGATSERCNVEVVSSAEIHRSNIEATPDDSLVVFDNGPLRINGESGIRIIPINNPESTESIEPPTIGTVYHVRRGVLTIPESSVRSDGFYPIQEMVVIDNKFIHFTGVKQEDPIPYLPGDTIEIVYSSSNSLQATIKVYNVQGKKNPEPESVRSYGPFDISLYPPIGPHLKGAFYDPVMWVSVEVPAGGSAHNRIEAFVQPDRKDHPEKGLVRGQGLKDAAPDGVEVGLRTGEDSLGVLVMHPEMMRISGVNLDNVTIPPGGLREFQEKYGQKPIPPDELIKAAKELGVEINGGFQISMTDTDRSEYEDLRGNERKQALENLLDRKIAEAVALTSEGGYLRIVGLLYMSPRSEANVYQELYGGDIVAFLADVVAKAKRFNPKIKVSIPFRYEGFTNERPNDLYCDPKDICYTPEKIREYQDAIEFNRIELRMGDNADLAREEIPYAKRFEYALAVAKKARPGTPLLLYAFGDWTGSVNDPSALQEAERQIGLAYQMFYDLRAQDVDVDIDLIHFANAPGLTLISGPQPDPEFGDQEFGIHVTPLFEPLKQGLAVR